MYVRTYVCTYLSLSLSIYLSISLSLYVSLSLYIYIYIHTQSMTKSARNLQHTTGRWIDVSEHTNTSQVVNLIMYQRSCMNSTLYESYEQKHGLLLYTIKSVYFLAHPLIKYLLRGEISPNKGTPQKIAPWRLSAGETLAETLAAILQTTCLVGEDHPHAPQDTQRC